MFFSRQKFFPIAAGLLIKYIYTFVCEETRTVCVNSHTECLQDHSCFGMSKYRLVYVYASYFVMHNS